MQQMNFVGHLGELRYRLIRIVILLMVVFVVVTYFSDELINLLMIPLRFALEPSGHIVYLNVLDKVITMFQVSAWVSLFMVCPYILLQIWFFIKPALYPKELSVLKPFFIAGGLFFYLGAVLAYFILIPLCLKFFMAMGASDVEAMISIRDYLLLSCQIILIVGLMCEIPLILPILAILNIISKDAVSKSRRYVYLCLAIFAAIITPADVASMLVVWILLIGLFELGNILMFAPLLFKRA
ncbi:MAG: twin-arginine translocase subunit TatC [Deltaproteobacteria bacterium]|nr:twin-arginine translocase subunit TatC [Deltaproteobacteria bacterium]